MSYFIGTRYRFKRIALVETSIHVKEMFHSFSCLANLNIPAVQRIDDRTTEVIANGLPLWHGSQLAIDTTLVPPLTAAGEPRRRGGRYAAAALHTARQNKQRTYPELLASARCWLVVMGMEVGGRWSQESAEFLRLLAQHKARSAPAPL